MEIKKILIIRKGAIGDVVHTTGLYRAIKKAYPKIEIDYATSKTTAELISDDCDLREIILLENNDYKYLFSLACKLKNKNYDLIINLQPQIKFRLFCALIGAKTATYKKDFRKHAVENFFDTAKKYFPAAELAPNLKLNINENVKSKVKEELNYDGNQKYVVFNMSAAPKRQGRKWKVDYFKELAIRLINDYNCNILLTGSKDDVELTAALKNLHEKIYDYAGKFSIKESAAMYSLCNLFISGDTGPLHIASACEKPVCIGVYGSMMISRTGVWGEKHYSLSAKGQLPCIPCNKRKCKLKNGQYNPCLDLLKPEIIFDLIKEEELL